MKKRPPAFQSRLYSCDRDPPAAAGEPRCVRKESLMRVQRAVVVLVLSWGQWGLAIEPEKPAADVSFFKDVLPILRGKNCTGCHQPAKRGGEYVMTDFSGLLKGGESGEAAVVPGKP